MSTQDVPGHIYIIHEREFIRLNEDVYKVGRTQNLMRRIKDYPKDSELIYCYKVDNIITIEKKVLEELPKHFIHRRDIGSEYFEGNRNAIIRIISKLLEFEIMWSICNPEKVFNSPEHIMKYIDIYIRENLVSSPGRKNFTLEFAVLTFITWFECSYQYKIRDYKEIIQYNLENHSVLKDNIRIDDNGRKYIPDCKYAS
jgi:hypothetical protein